MKNSVNPEGLSFKDFMKKANSTVEPIVRHLSGGRTIVKKIKVLGYTFYIPADYKWSLKDYNLKSNRVKLADLICRVDKDDDTIVWLDVASEASMKSSSFF